MNQIRPREEPPLRGKQRLAAAFMKLVSRLSMLPLATRLRIGRKYFKDLGPGVIQVSPTRLIKGPCHPSEVEAMQFVATHTTIPIPKVHRVHKNDKGELFIEMDFVKGADLGQAWMRNQLTDDDKDAILADIADVVSQLRKPPPPQPYGGNNIVGSALIQGQLWDARIGPYVTGPWPSHEAFHELLRGGAYLHEASKIFGVPVGEVHAKEYRSCFTHADLMPRNIIVHKGRVAAVIDWGFSGWYPEYWEFTKAHYGLFPRSDWYAALYEAIPRYDTELAAEQLLWTKYEEPGLTRYFSPEDIKKDPRGGVYCF